MEERGVSNNGRQRKRTCRGLGLRHVLALHPAQPGVGVLQQLLDALRVPLLKVKLLPLHLCHRAVQLHRRQNRALLTATEQTGLQFRKHVFLYVSTYMVSQTTKGMKVIIVQVKVTYKEHDEEITFFFTFLNWRF